MKASHTRRQLVYRHTCHSELLTRDGRPVGATNPYWACRTVRHYATHCDTFRIPCQAGATIHPIARYLLGGLAYPWTNPNGQHARAVIELDEHTPALVFHTPDGHTHTIELEAVRATRHNRRPIRADTLTIELHNGHTHTLTDPGQTLGWLHHWITQHHPNP